ncbi:MAG: TaqI-like C-terminal specificity domain-containing protein [Candidatus Bipolaricaulota bacterium]
MPTPREVRALVQRFSENRASYLSGPYNETQTRIEFVDPFFTALGWDVANVSGYAEAYKDVVHEDAIVIGGLTKAPDYSFRVGGARKFFVETKRPGVKIKDDAGPAFQLRRYAWSAKLPLSILTNFAELAVYDCRVKPERSDPASTARILCLTCDEYDARWDELAGIFAKEAVLKGSFDRYAESTKAKRGTAEVDDAFLAEIEGWREELARNLALRNPGLTQRELNFAVQRTIDRVIFLRICEDRGIEPYGGLQALLNGPNVYPRLGELFRRADERYNSGLFHFRPEKGRAEPPDELTLGLAVDDKVLKDILRRLYYPDSPYEFSVLPADILGQVYEQFLGKVIRLTAGHRAVVEAKPEVRKAGGVYYTPTYIVDYIVAHTVGVLLEGKTPHEVGGFTKAWKRSAKLRPLRVLDPACGSGSFLLGAYQYLLDWYQKKYVEDGPEKHAKGRSPRLYRVGLPPPAGLSVPPSPLVGEGLSTPPSPLVGEDPSAPPSPAAGRGVGGEGAWRLTTAERKRILLTHIYGVDIDPQAVEVTKLSLLLKVLEGETHETLDSFYRLFQERALPDLGANIKCGNSLIGPDFFAGAEYSLLGEEERYRINPFDWHVEFPDVFSGDSPGFDAVIGNPPYIQQSMAPYFVESVKEYLLRRYSSSMGRLNTFGFFLEAGLETMLACQGILAYIVPNTLLTQEYYEDLRRRILSHKILGLTTFVHPVFKGVVVETAIIAVQKTPPEGHELDATLVDNKTWQVTRRRIPQEVFDRSYRRALLVTADRLALSLKERVDRHDTPLASFANINQAIALKGDRKASLSDEKRGAGYYPVLDGRHIGRYLLRWDGTWLQYDRDRIHSCKRRDIFESAAKLLFRRVGDRLIATYDDQQHYALNTLVVITPRSECEVDLRYVLGLFNSRLMTYYYRTFLKSTKKVFSEIQARQVGQLPIRPVDFSDPEDKARHDKMVNLVQTMLDLHKELAAAKTAHEKTTLQRQITATDRQIDQLVYALYGLTEEEIKIVDGRASDH